MLFKSFGPTTSQCLPPLSWIQPLIIIRLSPPPTLPSFPLLSVSFLSFFTSSLPLFCQSSPNNFSFSDGFTFLLVPGQSGRDPATPTTLWQQQWITNSSSHRSADETKSNTSHCGCISATEEKIRSCSLQKTILLRSVCTCASFHAHTNTIQVPSTNGLQCEWRVCTLQCIMLAARQCWELTPLSQNSLAALHIHLIDICAYIPNEQFSLISKKKTEPIISTQSHGLTANFSLF